MKSFVADEWTKSAAVPFQIPADGRTVYSTKLNSDIQTKQMSSMFPTLVPILLILYIWLSHPALVLHFLYATHVPSWTCITIIIIA